MTERTAKDLEPMHGDEDGWSDWIHPTRGYLMGCCDCGLVHEMEFAIVQPKADTPLEHPGESSAGVVVFRARRAVPDR